MMSRIRIKIGKEKKTKKLARVHGDHQG